MREMFMEDFINENRDELIHAINERRYFNDGKGGRGTIPTPEPQYDTDEIEDWILNDEGLYNWAKSEGVDV